jgi:hypothetical protein
MDIGHVLPPGEYEREREKGADDELAQADGNGTTK